MGRWISRAWYFHSSGHDELFMMALLLKLDKHLQSWQSNSDDTA